MPADEEPASREWEGPDPRFWPGRSNIWDLVQDVETLSRTQQALNGADGTSRACVEALQFLAKMGQQLRARLALEILATYGIPAGGAGEDSLFAGAGGPRAFGADRRPPAAP